MQQIDTEHYPIYISEKGYNYLNEYIVENQPTKIFILVDTNTHDFCLAYLMGFLETNATIEILEIEPGEINKTIETTIQLWSTLAELEADRKSLLINLGGGLVSDLGGFIASTYKRGIACINIPTTLLSMVDASIGGKTGIDFDGLKNQIGTFSFPKLLIIDTYYLKTLPHNELISGFAEMLKHGLIADKKHWIDLISLPELTIENITPLITNSILVKKKVTDLDPFENGLRKILNFGHTIGHVIESYYLTTQKPLLHGEAIYMGMLAEAFLSKLIGNITEEDLIAIKQNIIKFYTPIKIPASIHPNLIEWLAHDKKNVAKTINFSLLNAIGNCGYDIEVTEEDIIKSLEFLG
ncbi:MAG: 3-dehydroquinate synthase [Solirubrobacteraceae bacterium]